MMAVTAPKILCPSMNAHMYQSAAVQRNIETLKSDGCFIITPDSGSLACGTTGPGRLPEPEDILDRVQYCLAPKDLKGKRILVTAGPTREAIDPVRYVSNPSSGKMGYALARAAEHRGGMVTLVTGPTSLPAPNNVAVIQVLSAEEMAERVYGASEQSDIIIKTAAVGDYRPKAFSEHKIKKSKDEMLLTLERTPDILKELGRRKKAQILVGFAAETRDLKASSEKKLAEKNLDMIAGNLIGPPDSGFGSDTNSITLFHKDGTTEKLPVMEKETAAHLILDRVTALLKG
jgi:phosphopantothenoylcysteine decarboxylase/phosphopantothenate--cysteine ligase